MGFVGSEPSQASVSSAGILDGAIVDADINASAAIAISKTAFAAGTGITLSTNTVNVDAAQTGINSLLATDIKIGEDDQTKIDFEDVNTINFYANNAKEVVLAENSISPGTSDGTALGTTSLMWSDLFLASAGVINFNNGNVTVTHAAGKLTTNADLEFYRDANNADVKLSLGTSATESLIIQVLNGGSNKTAEEVHFSTATASGTANHGKMVFDVDGSDIVTIDDSGLAATITTVSQPNVTTLAGLTTIGAVANALAMTFSDVTLFHDANNADTSFSIGTSAAEALKIEVLNGGSNKTAEAVHFSTATASGTADHGSMVFDIDGTDILTIDDGGLVIKTTGTIGPVGDEDLLTLTASGSIVTVAGEISVTTLDIGGTNVGSTAAELNLLDGSAKSTASITIADTDAFIIIDGTTTKQIPASDIAAYASGGGSFDATADGAISAGDLVGLATDGTVSTLNSGELNDMCTNAIPDTLTDLHDTSSSDTRGITCAYDPDNSKGVLIWREGSSTYDLMAAVVSLNTTTGAITIGSEAILHNGSSANYTNYSMGLPCIEYDTTADRFLVFFALSHSSGSSYKSFNAIVVDIDSTSIVSGTAQVVQANTTGGWEGRGGAEFMTGRGHMALSYARTSYDGDGGSMVTATRGGYIDVLTLDNSDNSFDVESSTKVFSGYDQMPSVAWDSVNGRFYYIHLDGSDDFMGMVVEHDNSDDSLTAGSDAIINGDVNTNLAYGVNYWLSAGQMAIFFSVGGSNDTDATPLGTYLQLFTVSGSGQTGTLSSNRTTVRTEKQHHDGFSMDAFSDLTTGGLDNMLALFYTDNGGSTSYMDIYSYVASGVTVAVEVDAETISTDHRYEESGAILSNGKGLSLIFVENGDTSQLQYITPALTSTVATTSGQHYRRWCGIANSAISDAATGTITSVGGTGTGQSGLTIGDWYEINTSAALVAMGESYNDTTYATVGFATSATTLYITGAFSN